MDKTPTKSGFLKAVHENHIALTYQPSNIHPKYIDQSIMVTNIKSLKFRKKHRLGKSILFGTCQSLYPVCIYLY